jgi:hypothetical protein
MPKTSSILDYQKPYLSTEIWFFDKKLKPEVKTFIGSCLKDFFDYLEIKGSDKWLLEAIIASSLATYFYTETSDLDIKLFIDLTLFIEYNQEFITFTDDAILKWLKNRGRESYWLTQKVPGTEHLLDIYFLSSKDLERLSTIKYDSIYLLSKNEWFKKPEKADYLPPDFILEIARQKAQPYINIIIEDIENAKQDCIDFLVLEDFLKTLDADDLFYLKQEFINQLNLIHLDIEEIIKDKNAIKEIRNIAFNKNYLDTELEKLMGSLNYSDGNLIFKLIQRYGYLKILVKVSEFFEKKNSAITEVDTILSLLNQLNEREILL